MHFGVFNWLGESKPIKYDGIFLKNGWEDIVMQMQEKNLVLQLNI